MTRNSRNSKSRPLALLCQHFYPELHSTGLLLSQLAVGLVTRGYALRVYCAQPTYWDTEFTGDAPKRENYKGVDIIRMPMLGNASGGIFSRSISAFSFLISSLWYAWQDRKKTAGIIITTNPPFLGLVAVILKYISGLEYVTIIHDVYPNIVVRLGILKPGSPIVWLWEKISRLIIAKSSCVIVLGEDMKEVILQKGKKGQQINIEVITNWADENLIRPIPKNENSFLKTCNLRDKFIVQYSGRMGRTHNLEPLIEAAEKLSYQSSILFQLIGDGAKLKDLQMLVKKKRLVNVQFLSYQPLEDLPMVLSAADICVVCLDGAFTGLSVPSKTYGILASGRPILGILDPRSEIGQTIIKNACGIILENPNGEQVAEEILQLIKEPIRLREMGENGREAFLNNYTFAEALDRHQQIFDTIFYKN